jgi:L-serine deaminase
MWLRQKFYGHFDDRKDIMTMQIKNGEELLAICREKAIPLHQLMLDYESKKSGKPQVEILELMRAHLRVMYNSAQQGLGEDSSLKGQIIGG